MVVWADCSFVLHLSSLLFSHYDILVGHLSLSLCLSLAVQVEISAADFDTILILTLLSSADYSPLCQIAMCPVNEGTSVFEFAPLSPRLPFKFLIA